MTGELDIRGGGAVAVDTETLRATAARFVGARVELDELAARLGAVQNMLFAERHAGAQSAASVLSRRLLHVQFDADAIAEQLRAAAAIYELVDLDAQHAAAVATGDEAALDRIARRRAALGAEYSGIGEQASLLAFERAIMWPSELVRQATETGFDLGGIFSAPAAVVGGVVGGLGTILGAGVVGFSRWGQIGRHERLAPARDAVTVERVSTGTTTAPASLAAAASRMPGDGATRVRVERYAMPGGSAQYAVYVSGTKSAGAGGPEAWDARSNVDLAAKRASASYEATLAALESAGARPGDTVHAFGHSQGAMITSHLALEGGYDTRTLVSFGSPVEADVGHRTLSVALRHTDDPIAGLAGGGSMAPVGAPGSFVVERSTDPTPDVIDAATPSHGMRYYAETAAMVDASTDPRVEAVRAVFAELGTAERVDVVEFGAERAVSPAASAGGAAGFRRAS
ncbi:hypothetical protein ACFC3F_04245 [Microbacterium sp. NPDC055910]|uniref:hypothetical protein n=1 Tax=Microbacterium sp. NPDC055910 TaxID=3345659 RepID=UPI0035E30CD8